MASLLAFILRRVNLPALGAAALGWRALTGGLRRGQPGLAGLGTAAVILSAIRKRRGPAKERIYRQTIKEGQIVELRVVHDPDD